MSEELYKAYRPQELDEVVGNASTIKCVQNALDNDAVPHLILLSGPSGCGKTTIARILKEKMNCSKFDFIEVNCADKRGIDYARDIVKSMNYLPMEGKCKIWLMDECHKLTADAVNAYLKPFEDTPEHVYFIMATTEPEKILKTVLTRATHWKVSALDEDEIGELVQDIAQEEEIEVPKKIVAHIAEASAGSSRMALVLLQQIANLSPKEMEEQIETMIEKESNLYELFKQLMWGRNWKVAASVLKALKDEPEGMRRGLLTMASNQLVGTNASNHKQAFKLIDCLSQPLYNTGKPGLVAGCYETISKDN